MVVWGSFDCHVLGPSNFSIQALLHQEMIPEVCWQHCRLKGSPIEIKVNQVFWMPAVEQNDVDEVLHSRLCEVYHVWTLGWEIFLLLEIFPMVQRSVGSEEVMATICCYLSWWRQCSWWCTSPCMDAFLCLFWFSCVFQIYRHQTDFNFWVRSEQSGSFCRVTSKFFSCCIAL